MAPCEDGASAIDDSGYREAGTGAVHGSYRGTRGEVALSETGRPGLS
jgi:hypothetical protein